MAVKGGEDWEGPEPSAGEVADGPDRPPVKVTVAGPESSGTRLMTALVEDLGVEAVHRSVPHGRDWWPDRGDEDRTHMLVITRDREKTLASQKRAGHLDAWTRLTPDEKFHASLGLLIERTSEALVPVLWVEYEDLVADPQQVMDEIADWLGVPPQKVKQQVDTDR